MPSASAAARRMREGGLALTWRPPEAAERAESRDDVAIDAVAGGEAASPMAAATLSILDGTDYLDADAPAAVVREPDGCICVEYAHPGSDRGRGRTNVDVVMALPHLGRGLLGALLDRCGGFAAFTLIKHLTSIRNCAAAVAATPYAGVPVADLPPDFVEHVAAARAKIAGRPLRFNGLEDLNRFRGLLSAMPGTGHLDLARRQNSHDLPGQWKMVDGEVVATPRLGFTDADIEKLAKRASLEIRETIARWNQFVAFRDGRRDAEGPSSPMVLRAAGLLLDTDRSRPVYWKSFLKRGSAGHRLFFDIGWDFVAAMSRGEHDADLDPAAHDNAALIRMHRRYVAAGDDAASYYSNPDTMRNGFVERGWKVAVRVAYPTRRDMCGPVVALGLLTRFNPGVLAAMKRSGLRPRDLHWSELEDCEAGDAPPGRVVAAPYKPRAGRLQPVDFPVTDDPEDPVPLTRFLQGWTAHIRGSRPRVDSDLFLFVNGQAGTHVRAVSFASSNLNGLRSAFTAFCKRAGTAAMTPKVLRSMGIDIIHERTGGDPMLVHASGNWAVGSVMPALYLGGPALARGRERLYWAGRLLERQREHGILVEGRPRNADLFAVEDGFACRQPLDGPDPLPPGEVCRSRGMCAICPHARLDLASPAWSFARLAARAAYLAARLGAGAPPGWARRYRPVLVELLEIWIPMFPDDVVEAARRVPDYPCLELPDAPE